MSKYSLNGKNNTQSPKFHNLFGELMTIKFKYLSYANVHMHVNE